jgi:hypothetical protein
VRFQVLTAASIKMTVFCGVALYSLAEADRRFRGVSCLHHQGDYTAQHSRTVIIDVLEVSALDLLSLLLHALLEFRPYRNHSVLVSCIVYNDTVNLPTSF